MDFLMREIESVTGMTKERNYELITEIRNMATEHPNIREIEINELYQRWRGLWIKKEEKLFLDELLKANHQQVKKYCVFLRFSESDSSRETQLLCVFSEHAIENNTAIRLRIEETKYPEFCIKKDGTMTGGIIGLGMAHPDMCDEDKKDYEKIVGKINKILDNARKQNEKDNP